MSVHQFVKNAQVEVIPVKDNKRRDCATITVNDQFQHTFPHTSRVSKHLDVMSPEQLQSRLSGGSFFFINQQLVDWRDGSYTGFTHTDDTIKLYMDLFGFQYRNKLSHIHQRNVNNDDHHNNNDILLRSVWDKTEIHVPGYQSGGDFHSELSFVWNPFTSFINSAFDLVRLICTNGMIGTTSFLNTKVPLVNRQTEHLDIAAKQIQNKVNSIVTERVQIMGHERASVGQCLLLENHIIERLSSHDMGTADEHTKLFTLLNAVSPKQQLDHVYRESVFDNRDLAAQLPAHLTTFDIFNIATELRTHTSEAKKSSNFALDKFSNMLLFDNNDNPTYISTKANNPLASFSNPEQAFFSSSEVA